MTFLASLSWLCCISESINMLILVQSYIELMTHEIKTSFRSRLGNQIRFFYLQQLDVCLH